MCVLKIDSCGAAECNECVRFSFERVLTPFGVPVRTSCGIFLQRESIVVRIEDRCGNISYGECAPWAGFGCESLAEAEDFLKKCNGIVPEEIPENLPCTTHAFCSAKFFLGNPGLENVPVPDKELCAKLIRRSREDSPEQVLEKVSRERENGYSVFKMKIGFGTATEELRFCEKILSSAPAETRFRFDANGAFSEEILPDLAALSASPNTEFFEQPLPASKADDDKVFEAAEIFPAKFALDESVREPWAFPRDTRVVAVVKPLLVADFSRLLTWLEVPKGPGVVVSTVFENSPAGACALRMSCARVAASRRRAFGLG